MARSYSDRQTREDAEERGETTQINALSRLVKQAYTQGHWGPHSMRTQLSVRSRSGLQGCCPCGQQQNTAGYKLFCLLSFPEALCPRGSHLSGHMWLQSEEQGPSRTQVKAHTWCQPLFIRQRKCPRDTSRQPKMPTTHLVILRVTGKWANSGLRVLEDCFGKGLLTQPSKPQHQFQGSRST